MRVLSTALSLLLLTSPVFAQQLPVVKVEKPVPKAQAMRIDTGGPPGQAIRNLVRPAGFNSHALTGYGLVVGLPKTGDSSATLVSPVMTHLLTSMGLNPMLADVQGMKSRNVAIVAITAKLPSTARSGDPIDVEVASLGDAKNLSRGMLLRSLLRGPDDQIYAYAQGQVTAIAPDSDNRVVGRVSEGGTVSRAIDTSATERDRLVLNLLRPDLTTATNIAEKIGFRLGVPCRVISSEAVEVNLAGTSYDVMSALAVIEDLTVATGDAATIVVNRDSKSVVVGGPVPLRPALISHNGMTVEIGPQGSDLKTVLESLSKMGATPEDIVAILESLRQAGALDGKIEYR